MSITREIVEDNYNRKIKPFLIEHNSCILYSKATPRKPYGYIAFTPITAKLPNILAHRLSYMYHNNILSTEGFFVLHSCDTPACCNPEHLRLGTNADNMQDKVVRGRSPDQKGSANNFSKLLEKEVLRIYLAGGTFRYLGNIFNVHHTVIGKIKNKTTWKHLTDAYDELMVA